MSFTYYIYTLIPLVLIDGTWLTLMGAQYKRWLGPIMAPRVTWWPVALFYIIYAAGITYFIVEPALKGNFSLTKVVLTGALLGLIAYGAYDMTNNATLLNWPLATTIVDMLWGMVLTGLASLVSVLLARYF